MKDKPHSIIPGSEQDAAAESESELSQIRKRLRVVEAQYSVEVVTEQLIRHYESLLQQRGLVG